MKFRRKKKQGPDRKTRRLWLSPEGYRIIWRKEVHRVTVRAGYQVCVRTIVPGNFETGQLEIWDFVNPNKPLSKTMKAAVAACEQHQELWSRATECTGIRAFRELFGRQPSAIPKWVLSKLNRRIMAILLDVGPRCSRDHEEESDAPSSETPPVTKPATKKPQRKQVTTTKKKRKQRSDKGKKRGPRKGIKK